MRQILPNEQATQEFGLLLAKALRAPCVIYLDGELGAGKTTLVRAVIKSFAYEGPVKSPSYTLLEPYQCGGLSICHLDLYRIADPEEVDFLGIRDYLEHDCILFIEWPEKGEGFLPVSDVLCHITIEGDGRTINLEALTPVGYQLIERMRSI